MGYRSLVAMMVYGSPEQVDIVDNLLLQKLNPEYDRDMFENKKQVKDQERIRDDEKIPERMILWTFDDIKWYSEMQAYQEFVRALVEQMTEEDTSSRLAYEFVRVGENTDDTEEEYSSNAEYLLYVTRRIEIPDNFTWKE